MGDAAVDEQAPDGFSDIGRQVVGLRRDQNLGDHVVDAGLVEDGFAVGLDAGGGVHVALALGQQGDKGAVKGVDALADFGHRLAFGGIDAGVDSDKGRVVHGGGVSRSGEYVQPTKARSKT